MDSSRTQQFEISDQYIWRLIMEKNIEIFNLERLRVKKIKNDIEKR
jgi:hypothetical protein